MKEKKNKQKKNEMICLNFDVDSRKTEQNEIKKKNIT